MFTEQEQQLNQEIQRLLVELVTHSGQALQLEIVYLIKQIERIKLLLLRQRSHWLNKLLHQQHTSELSFLLEDVKDTLLVLKSTPNNISVIQEYRVNLEKNINGCQGFLLKYFLNIYLEFYYTKSNTFKILCGLMVTATLAISSLVWCISVHHGKLLEDGTLINDIAPLPNESASAKETVIPNNSQNSSSETSAQLANQNLLNLRRQIGFGLIYSSIAGVLGSVTSILLRIIQFRDEQYNDPLSPFFIGMFKPVIGLMFGIFLCALIYSETIVNLGFAFSNNDSSKFGLSREFRENCFLFTCAFLIGFSERLGKDIMQKSERQLSEGLFLETRPHQITETREKAIHPNTQFPVENTLTGEDGDKNS